MRKRSKPGHAGRGTDRFGYDDLRIPEVATRTLRLQGILCTFAEDGGNVDDVDRTALLGMLQIVGELEAALREVLATVPPEDT